MSHQLPDRPNLEHLKSQAKDLVTAFRNGSEQERVHAFLPGTRELSLSNAQFVIAREYGFDSWPKLKAYVDLHTAALDRRERADALVAQLVTDQFQAAEETLKNDPTLAEASLAASCVVGLVDAVTKQLEGDPGLVHAKVRPKEWTPILYVCYSRLLRNPSYKPGLLATAKLLLDRGADPNDRWLIDDWKETCLYGATGVNDAPELVEMLLKAGAETTDDEAFYHSAELDRPDCLRLLLQYGGKIGNAFNAMARLLDFERPDRLRMVLELTPDRTELPAVIPHALRRERSDETLQILIESGIDLNAKDSNGLTPYESAVRLGRSAVAKMLADAGADTSLTDADRVIARILAGETIEPGSVDRATIASLDHERSPQQCIWGAHGRTKELEALLNLGADPNASDENGWVPLHEAGLAGHLDTVRVLLKHGADPAIRDRAHDGNAVGFTCHGSQHWKKQPPEVYVQIVSELLDHGGPLPNRAWGSPEVQALLISRGCDQESR